MPRLCLVTPEGLPVIDLPKQNKEVETSTEATPFEQLCREAEEAARKVSNKGTSND